MVFVFLLVFREGGNLRFFIVFHCVSWFVIVFFIVFERTGFQGTGYPSMIFIDGHPSMNIIDGYPSMNINGCPTMNIYGIPVL